MNRFHLHIAVSDLEASIRFYTVLFKAEPGVVQMDYAKWMLEDPRINFAISTRSSKTGLDHLGLQVESDEALNEIQTRLNQTEQPVTRQENAGCCYARSDKYWSIDPDGIAWEAFHTLDNIPVFGDDNKPGMEPQTSACCPQTSC